jgi:hypothetical protein
MSLFIRMLLTISLIFLGMDPVYISLKLFSLIPSPASFSSFILLTARLAFVTPLMYAITRSISFVMIWGILVLRVLLHCIELSGKNISKIWNSTNSFASFHKHLNLYQSLNLIVSGYVGVFSSPLAVAIMSAGFGLEIASVFTIIRAQFLIQVSWPIYVGAIILAVIIPLFADAELPEAIRIFDNTDVILRHWKLKMTIAVGGSKRYYIRKIASLRPCSMYAGLGDVMFFSLRKSTKTTYYGLMVYYVVNTLISVPESFTSRFHL